MKNAAPMDKTKTSFAQLLHSKLNEIVITPLDDLALAHQKFLIVLQTQDSHIPDFSNLMSEQKEKVAKICLLWVIHLPAGWQRMSSSRRSEMMSNKLQLIMLVTTASTHPNTK